jgi:hypothetical protein
MWLCRFVDVVVVAVVVVTVAVTHPPIEEVDLISLASKISAGMVEIWQELPVVVSGCSD